METKSCLLHTLRIYDEASIEKIKALMKRIEYRFKDNNAFYTELIMLGYERYLELHPVPGIPTPPSGLPEGLKEIYPLLVELSTYTTEQFKNLYVNQKITHKLLAAVYRIVLGVSEDVRVAKDKIEEGFYDDLPERFKEIIEELKTRYGAACS